MADLFHYTDEDGDTLTVEGHSDLAGHPVAFAIDREDVCVFVDRAAALRLAAALLKHYGQDITEESTDG